MRWWQIAQVIVQVTVCPALAVAAALWALRRAGRRRERLDREARQAIEEQRW